MAKWGEGDPRWIVEDRPDAKNVNNWHWTEKNATPWSKTRLTELFDGLEIESEKGKLKITSVTKVEGEACANNRKAKLIFFYEWVIDLEWSGTLTDSENILKGKVEIPNLSEEHEPEDVDVLVTANRNTEEGSKLKDIMRSEGVKVIRDKLSQYIKELKQEFSQGMILPSKDKTVESKSSVSVNGSSKGSAKNSPVVPRKGDTKENDSGNKIGCPISTKKLEMKDVFLASAEDLYNTLIDKKRLEIFTMGPVKVDATRGGSFVLFNGNVSGKFRDLVIDEKIVMDWRYKSWPEGHYSSVTITLKQLEDRTELLLEQKGVPEMELERTHENWKRYYWDSIKQRFFYGMKYF